MSSFISKVELKYQLRKMGIEVKGNYVRKSDIKRIVTTQFDPKDWTEEELDEVFKWKDAGSSTLKNARSKIPRMPDGEKRKKVLDTLASEVEVKIINKKCFLLYRGIGGIEKYSQKEAGWYVSWPKNERTSWTSKKTIAEYHARVYMEHHNENWENWSEEMQKKEPKYTKPAIVTAWIPEDAIVNVLHMMGVEFENDDENEIIVDAGKFQLNAPI